MKATKAMKYIFFGTPRFAEIVLDGLICAHMPPVALVCNPDRPVGRKKIVTPPATKRRVSQASDGIEVLQPEKLNDAVFIKQLQAMKPDLFVVTAYSKILPKAILDIPRLGTLGVHPSLLPKYRGASPIQSAILGGEKETGTTIYVMDEKTDHGPILATKDLRVNGGDAIFMLPYLELEERLATMGGELLIEAMPKFLDGTLYPQEQNESMATYTKKFKTEDGFVDEKDLAAAEHGDAKKATEILEKINALNPEPGAWTMKGGKRVKLLAAALQNETLVLEQIQEEGQRPRTL